MSKLRKIRDTLEQNPEVVIVTVDDNIYVPERSDYWSQTIDFIVAPKNGLYTVDELQQFMMSLVPSGMELTTKDNFWDGGDTIDVGVLYFDEVIGTETKEIVLTDEEILAREELLSSEGFVGGKKVTATEELRRRTWIRVYPDPKIAKENYNNAYRFHIPKKILGNMPQTIPQELPKTQKRRFAKLRKIFSKQNQ